MIEKRHYRSIREREHQLRDIMIFPIRNVPPSMQDSRTELVSGSVVVGMDYFKKTLAKLRNIVGGRVGSFESLLDRARREAILRMKEEAREMNAKYIFNVKYSTANIMSGNKNNNGNGAVEVIAMAPQSSPGDARQPDFVNPAVADGINNPPENQFKSFFVNLGLVTAALVALIILINVAATYLTPFVPFSWEREVVGPSLFGSELDSSGAVKQEELRRLGDTLSGAMDLPPGTTISVFYNPDRTVNAFATLGGNIVVFQGLLDLVESEDELAMVLAHEIGHVKNRDAIKGVVRALGLTLLMMGIQDSSGYADQVMNVGMAGYSRGQEAAADREAVRALGTVYGHAGGAAEFFTNLATKVEKRPTNAKAPMFSGPMASHPDTLRRLEGVRVEAGRANIPRNGTLTPLPEVLR